MSKAVKIAPQKTSVKPSRPPLVAIPVGEVGQRWAVNIVGLFPKSHTGAKYIIYFVEFLTKWPESVCVPDITAATVPRALMEAIVYRHGAMSELLSFRGNQFLSEPVRVANSLSNTVHHKTTSFRPHGNGLCEKQTGQ